MTYLTYVIVTDLLPDVDSPTVCLFVCVCHVLSCDMHVTSYCHSSTVHLFGIDTSLWYYPPLQTPTETETAPSCTAALLEAVLQCVSLEEVVLEDCSFGMKCVRHIGMCILCRIVSASQCDHSLLLTFVPRVLYRWY